MSKPLSSKLWEVRSTAHKGFGVFAKFPIPRGTRIFSEPPLLFIRPDQDASNLYISSLLLAQKDRSWLLGLSTYATRESSVIRWTQAGWWTLKSVTGHLVDVVKGKERFSWSAWNVKEHVDILSVFRNNSFALGDKGIGTAVFRGISRINHSCVPNSQGNFHAEMGRFNVHATRDIEVDEEVTVSYLPEHGATREGRMGKLRGGYGFECGCPACDLDGDLGQDTETRRLYLQDLIQTHAKLAQDLLEVEQMDASEMTEEGRERHSSLLAKMRAKNSDTDYVVMGNYIRMLEEGGIAGRELASL